jgi:vacuolar protein sorting-associated protein 13A/C
MYLSLANLHLDVLATNLNQQLELHVGRFQVDNQLYGARFPILIYPVFKDLPDVTDKTMIPFLQFTLQRATCNDVDYFHAITFAMQEIEVSVDGLFIVRAKEFLDVIMKSPVFNNTADLPQTEEEELQSLHGESFTLNRSLRVSRRASRSSRAKPVAEECKSIFAPTQKAVDARMLFVGLFFLNPISIVLSFASVPGVQSDDILNKVLSFSGGALTNIDRAQIKLNMLGLKNVFMTREEFVNLVQEHYKGQLLSQVYTILGSFEFLGSPLSLVNNLGTGVYDFFYEPAQGLVKADPQEFAKGVAKGTSSLVGNLAQGVFNSAGKFTGSLGRGAATLSFDTDYLREREKASRDKPRHAAEGVAYGIRDFGKGLWHGATGVLTQPIKGAKQDGIVGFGKGIGKGADPCAGIRAGLFGHILTTTFCCVVQVWWALRQSRWPARSI